MASVLLCWDQGQLCCGLNKVQLMGEQPEEGRIACECLARCVERRGCRRTTVKGFADEVHFTRQGSRRLLCWEQWCCKTGRVEGEQRTQDI